MSSPTVSQRTQGRRASSMTVPWPIHAMAGLGVVMSLVFLAIVLGPYRRFRRTTDRTRMTASLDTIRRLIAVNLVLGLVTVVVAALFHVV